MFEAERALKTTNYAIKKFKANRGFFHVPYYLHKEHDIWPAVQQRGFQSMYGSDGKLLNFRQLLTLMGMPYDYEIIGNSVRQNAILIGQNVPVCTARWVVQCAMDMLNHVSDKTADYSKIVLVNNTDKIIETIDV